MDFRVLCGSAGYARSRVRVLKIVTCFLLLLSGCRRSAHETPKPTATQATGTQFHTPPQLPDCDPAPSRFEASRSVGHHRVVLTWGASSSSSGSSDQSVGYCIYRSRNEDITAKDLPHCKNCTRLNRKPILGTGCVDTHVEDGTTYYYVAGAVEAGTKVNRFSNKTTAVIPANSQSKDSDSSYPLCQPDDSTAVRAPTPNR